MFSMYTLYQQPQWLLGGLLIISIWMIVWKGLALWHASQNKQKGWFIAFLVLNTLGLLPIIYLIWFKPVSKEEVKKINEVKEKTSKNKK